MSASCFCLLASRARMSLDVKPSLDATEPLFHFNDRGTDPADNHPSALSTLHAPRVRDDFAVQILDRIRRAELLVEKTAET
jgi:hypothetical protein